MDKETLRDIEAFVNENEAAIFADIAELVSVESVCTAPRPGMPFGAGPAKALDTALRMAERMGLSTRNCEDYIGYAQIGEGGPDCRDYLATVTHLDAVPVSEGWTADPFTLREREGYVIGRGVMDDKGPSVLCLYALKYLKERAIPLRYPVRALLGINEEVGMEDVLYYLKNYPAPLFCFSPDANFPLCNGEKGIAHGRIVAKVPMENIVDIRGGQVANAIPDKAEAWVKTDRAESRGRVTAEKTQDGLIHLTATGIGGHASWPQGTVNAIGELIRYLLEEGLAGKEEEKFLRLAARVHESADGSALGVQAKDDKFEPLTIVSGVIGVKDGRMVQSLDVRYPTTTSGKKVVDTIQALAGDVAEVILDSDNPPFYMSTDKAEVQACLNAYNEVTGENAKPYTIGGGTYARDFPNAVSFGPEHPERPHPDFAGPIHGVDEAAKKADFLEALKVYILALLKLEKLTF